MRYIIFSDINPTAGGTDPLQVSYYPYLGRSIPEIYPNYPLQAILNDFIVLDELLFMKDADNFFLQSGSRDINRPQTSGIRVADPGQKIRDWIGHSHTNNSPSYQLALVTPGILPSLASCRKQIRHILNLR